MAFPFSDFAMERTQEMRMPLLPSRCPLSLQISSIQHLNNHEEVLSYFKTFSTTSTIPDKDWMQLVQLHF